VTNNKRINRDLWRKDTSFVCCASSVLRTSRHMKQKEKLRTPAKIKPIWTPPLNTATTLFNKPDRLTAIQLTDWQKNLSAFSRGFCLRRSPGLQQTVTCSGKSLGRQLKLKFRR